MAKKKLKLNIPLLREIKKTILEVPQRYNQNEVVALGEPGEVTTWTKQAFPAGGTIACIGGWAYILGHSSPKKRIYAYDLLEKARKLLGLDKNQSGVLFRGSGGDWPTRFKQRFEKVKTPTAKAKVAADFLDEVTTTKGQNLTDAYLAGQTDNEGVFEEWENMP